MVPLWFSSTHADFYSSGLCDESHMLMPTWVNHGEIPGFFQCFSMTWDFPKLIQLLPFSGWNMVKSPCFVVKTMVKTTIFHHFSWWNPHEICRSCVGCVRRWAIPRDGLVAPCDTQKKRVKNGWVSTCFNHGISWWNDGFNHGFNQKMVVSWWLTI